MCDIKLNEVYKPKKNYTVIVKTVTFNHSKYIEDTLNGIAMQNTNFPFVNIVLEDNSTDGEQDVIRIWLDRECDLSLAEYYDIPTAILIIVPHKKNINCTFAIYFHKKNLFQQKNIRESQVHPWRYNSKYEALCEGDDYWIDPYKLQKQVDFLDANHTYGLCYTRTKRFYQETNRFGKIWGGPHQDFEHILQANPIPTLTVVAKTDLVLQYVREIEPQRRSWKMVDYPMWLWFAYNSQIKFIDIVSSVYRILPKSASHSDNIEDLIAFSHSVVDIQGFFYTKYTSINFNIELQKWRRSMMYYANYNMRQEFFSLWKRRKDQGLSLGMLGGKILLVYVLMYIRIYPFVFYVKSRV